MPDSKRLKILKSLTSLLEETVGYELADKVWRGRNRPGDESEMPYLIIFEQPPEESIRAAADTSKMQWYLGIQGYVEGDIEHPSDAAHDLLAAVKTTIGAIVDDGRGRSPGENYMLGGLITDLSQDGGMVFLPDETTKGCLFGLKLAVSLSESLEDLYEE